MAHGWSHCGMDGVSLNIFATSSLIQWSTGLNHIGWERAADFPHWALPRLSLYLLWCHFRLIPPFCSTSLLWSSILFFISLLKLDTYEENVTAPTETTTARHWSMTTHEYNKKTHAFGTPKIGKKMRSTKKRGQLQAIHHNSLRLTTVGDFGCEELALPSERRRNVVSCFISRPIAIV